MFCLILNYRKIVLKKEIINKISFLKIISEDCEEEEYTLNTNDSVLEDIISYLHKELFYIDDIIEGEKVDLYYQRILYYGCEEYENYFINRVKNYDCKIYNESEKVFLKKMLR